VVLESPRSNSRIASLYDSAFLLSWDNDISFHVAQNAIRLRKFRGQSQDAVAKAMGTSQSAVARIEGEDENITLRTLKRLAEALSGRIRFAIEPSDVNLPRWPDWWHMMTVGINAAGPYVFQGAMGKADAAGQQIVAGWSAKNNLPLAGTSGEVVSIAEAK
jgi:DNA-binding Xre family transcriptional regulator